MTVFTTAPLPCGCDFNLCKYHFELSEKARHIHTIGPIFTPITISKDERK